MSSNSFPLADVHVHLEAAISVDLLKQFAEEKGRELPPAYDDGKFDFQDLPHFLEHYNQLNDVLIKSADDYYRLTKDFLERQAALNTIYTDIIIAPSHGEMAGIGYWDFMEAITTAMEDVRQDKGIYSTASYTVVRGDLEFFGPEQATRWAQKIADTINQYPQVTSFGIAGNEHHGQLSDYKESFDIARGAGLALRAHVGESTDAQDIRYAVDTLKIDIIDHGLKMVDDPDLIKEIARAGKTTTITITSNELVLKDVATAGLENHPIWKMRKAGVSIALGTDDPVFFNTDIAREYQRIQTIGKLSNLDMLKFTEAAISLPIVPKHIQRELLRKIERWKKQNLTDASDISRS